MIPTTGSRKSEIERRKAGTRSPKPEIDGQAPVNGRLKAIAFPFVLTLTLLALMLAPPVQGNSRLISAFIGVSVGLLLWQALLFHFSKRAGRSLQVEFVPIKSHYVQASVQFCIYVYWGWYWRKVYAEAPLILSQLLFLYVFDALLSWSRGRRWRLGFGPFPIILSTNLFMWFRDEYFIFQFLMVATGALGKEFIRWQRNGKKTHIFNPSALGLTVFSFALLFSGTTRYTWGEELATFLTMPHYIYLQIFLLGLVVQYFFSVTLMTLSATAVLCLFNLIYTRATGVYFFIDSNIPIAVFLGLHLLMTDPATSPRSNAGRMIFGGLYGLGVWLSYSILVHFHAPSFYDKLLVVPFLNLGVKVIERVAAAGFLGRFTRWEDSFKPKTLNLAHMACWGTLFIVMLTTGFVQAPHPGSSIAFWKQAAEAGKPRAGQNLVLMLQDAALKGSGEAWNELGLMSAEGRLTPRDPVAAEHYFAQACANGYSGGCANVAIHFLFYSGKNPDAEVLHALDQLEKECAQGSEGQNYYLLGYVYETGRGRALDKRRARELYTKGQDLGDVGACKNLAHMQLSAEGGPADPSGAVVSLQKACDGRDAQSCLVLASLYHHGSGVQPDETRSAALLQKACELGSPEACKLLRDFRK